MSVRILSALTLAASAAFIPAAQAATHVVERDPFSLTSRIGPPVTTVGTQVVWLMETTPSGGRLQADIVGGLQVTEGCARLEAWPLSKSRARLIAQPTQSSMVCSVGDTARGPARGLAFNQPSLRCVLVRLSVSEQVSNPAPDSFRPRLGRTLCLG
ncbi:MAG: hypothetical protein ACT4P1_17030 [Sporichthyaceae bacterium]